MINPPDRAGRGTGTEMEEEEERTGCGSRGRAFQVEGSGCDKAGLSSVGPTGVEGRGRRSGPGEGGQ